MNLYLYSLDSFKEALKKQEKNEERSYVLIKDLNDNYNFLKHIDEYTVNHADLYSYLVEPFLKNLNSSLVSIFQASIPFDGMKITGGSGLVLNYKKYHELFEEFIQYYFGLEKNLKQNERLSNFIRTKVKDLKIDDVAYNWAPLNLSYIPYLRIGDEKKPLFPSFDFGIKKQSFTETVRFDKFLQGINNYGYSLTYNGVEIKTFDDYFNGVISTTDFSNPLCIDVDLRDNNNIRR